MPAVSSTPIRKVTSLPEQSSVLFPKIPQNLKKNVYILPPGSEGGLKPEELVSGAFTTLCVRDGVWGPRSLQDLLTTTAAINSCLTSAREIVGAIEGMASIGILELIEFEHNVYVVFQPQVAHDVFQALQKAYLI